MRFGETKPGRFLPSGLTAKERSTITDDMTDITVAIDGPAGAGKSTVARTVADKLGYTLVDTGAIYRAVALLAKRQGVPWDDDDGLAAVVGHLDIAFELRDGKNLTLIAGVDVSDDIRTPEISTGASRVSARPVVRNGLLALQRQLAGRGGAVLEGRDVGTVVCPDAPVKIYLDASPEERARRRCAELDLKGHDARFDAVLSEIRERDARDQGRDQAPLKPADDAIILDSTKLNIDEVVAQILDAVRTAMRGLAGN